MVGMLIILFQKRKLLYAWAAGILIEMQFDFADVSFRVRYAAPKVRSLRKVGVNLCLP